MCSYDEIVSSLDDPHHLSILLKEKSHSILSDSIYFLIVKHFLSLPISIEGLAVQRNLYGRPRSSSLDQCELDLLIYNIKGCLNKNCQELIKPFLQYLHNINRLLPIDFCDITSQCALILLGNKNKNIIACIICAYLERNLSNNIRFDLIINGLYENEEDEEEDNPWIDQLTKILIDKDKQWLRKYYLEKIYTKEFLLAIDTHNKEKIFKSEQFIKDPQQLSTSTIQEIDLTTVSSLNELHSGLSSYIETSLPDNLITETSLFHLLSYSNNSPDELHILFVCSLISIIDSSNYSISTLCLFRRLINLINNYYINQQDLLDDNNYRLIIVYLISKLLCEFHRRRSNNEHKWYRLYIDVPQDDPLPTSDLFSDLLCLLSTLCYKHRDCQNEVRDVFGTIESILSMTQIDLNQPKSQTCVTWLLKCLTEDNEENRNYIKKIK